MLALDHLGPTALVGLRALSSPLCIFSAKGSEGPAFTPQPLWLSRLGTQALPEVCCLFFRALKVCAAFFSSPQGIHFKLRGNCHLKRTASRNQNRPSPSGAGPSRGGEGGARGNYFFLRMPMLCLKPISVQTVRGKLGDQHFKGSHTATAFRLKIQGVKWTRSWRPAFWGNPDGT